MHHWNLKPFESYKAWHYQRQQWDSIKNKDHIFTCLHPDKPIGCPNFWIDIIQQAFSMPQYDRKHFLFLLSILVLKDDDCSTTPTLTKAFYILFLALGINAAISRRKKSLLMSMLIREYQLIVIVPICSFNEGMRLNGSLPNHSKDFNIFRK